MMKNKSLDGLLTDPETSVVTLMVVRSSIEAWGTHGFAMNMMGLQEGLTIALTNPTMAKRILRDFNAHQEDDYIAGFQELVDSYEVAWNQERDSLN